ncbi:MAG: hypothetical protein MHM6MM_000442 [Cercozoa sp. M6MM]
MELAQTEDARLFEQLFAAHRIDPACELSDLDDSDSDDEHGLLVAVTCDDNIERRLSRLLPPHGEVRSEDSSLTGFAQQLDNVFTQSHEYANKNCSGLEEQYDEMIPSEETASALISAANTVDTVTSLCSLELQSETRRAGSSSRDNESRSTVLAALHHEVASAATMVCQRRERLSNIRARAEVRRKRRAQQEAARMVKLAIKYEEQREFARKAMRQTLWQLENEVQRRCEQRKQEQALMLQRILRACQSDAVREARIRAKHAIQHRKTARRRTFIEGPLAFLLERMKRQQALAKAKHEDSLLKARCVFERDFMVGFRDRDLQLAYQKRASALRAITNSRAVLFGEATLVCCRKGLFSGVVGDSVTTHVKQCSAATAIKRRWRAFSLSRCVRRRIHVMHVGEEKTVAARRRTLRAVFDAALLLYHQRRSLRASRHLKGHARKLRQRVLLIGFRTLRELAAGSQIENLLRARMACDAFTTTRKAFAFVFEAQKARRKREQALKSAIEVDIGDQVEGIDMDVLERELRIPDERTVYGKLVDTISFKSREVPLDPRLRSPQYPQPQSRHSSRPSTTAELANDLASEMPQHSPSHAATTPRFAFATQSYGHYYPMYSMQCPLVQHPPSLKHQDPQSQRCQQQQQQQQYQAQIQQHQRQQQECLQRAQQYQRRPRKQRTSDARLPSVTQQQRHVSSASDSRTGAEIGEKARFSLHKPKQQQRYHSTRLPKLPSNTRRSSKKASGRDKTDAIAAEWNVSKRTAKLLSKRARRLGALEK